MCPEQNFHIMQLGKFFMVDGNESHLLQTLTLLTVMYDVSQAIERIALCQFFLCLLNGGCHSKAEAELKIFVVASAEIRAQRRYDELKAKGQEASYDEILANVKERDYIDQNREVSPLRQADDAILLDNSNLTIGEQKQWLKERFEEAVKE